jgi:IclR family transcriptional regulator, acetate operon repressor
MEVKLVARTVDLFDLFAREAKPLSLTELARGLGTPMSSTLALVRTLAEKGFLYETRRRGGYYPTRKMLDACLGIAAAEPLLDLMKPHLARLRDTSGETVVLGKRLGVQVTYLDVAASAHPIRYTAAAGDVRPLQLNSLGKALFSALPPAERKKLAGQIPWQKPTGASIHSARAFLADAETSAERGWAANVGESVPDLAAVAMPFSVTGEWFALSIVGPLGRMQAAWQRHVDELRAAVAALQLSLQSGDGASSD